MKFLQVIKNPRNGVFKHQLLAEEDIKKAHPYHMEIRSWLYGPKIGSRFGLSMGETRYIYVRTNEKNEDELQKIAMRV